MRLPELLEPRVLLAGDAAAAAGNQAIVDQDVPSRDVVIPDDLIVDGSACVGFDCVNGESFGFDTLRIKENNTRLTFIDTSVTASFPQRDWQIRANESTNGGRNALFIDDLGNSATSGSSISSTPFTLEAGAPSNSLYVESDGDLGLGTNNPVADVHVVSGNTPTARLEQNGSSGFTAQTWDVAGNEAGFFVRDATNGSTLPFRIRPAAPTSAIDIAAGGNIGIGTTSPSSSLHLLRTDGSAQLRVEDVNGTAAARNLLSLENFGFPQMTLSDDSGNGSWSLRLGNNDLFAITRNGTAGFEFRIRANGEVVMGPAGASQFVLNPAGNLTIAGTLTAPSSAAVKQDLVLTDSASILEKLAALEVLQWNYIASPDAQHIGPVAEDFYAAFGLGEDDQHLAPSDLAGVTLAGLQELQQIVMRNGDQIADAMDSLGLAAATPLVVSAAASSGDVLEYDMVGPRRPTVSAPLATPEFVGPINYLKLARSLGALVGYAMTPDGRPSTYTGVAGAPPTGAGDQTMSFATHDAENALLERLAELLSPTSTLPGPVSVAGLAQDAENARQEHLAAAAAGQGVVDQDVPSRDVVIADDLIVDGSMCVGFDCVNGEVFSFDTMRLKENNLRINFQDTSTSASFPSRDWRILANDTSNGGLNRFSIEDVDGGRIPFTIEAGAPTNAFYLEDSGELGLGTSNPVVDLHVVSGNSPTMRLEQDGTSGFTAQTWDVVGNEANFFIRDVTNSSKLPLRIRPGAPSSAIDIAATGNVGLGTGSPSNPLHVRRTNGTAQIFVEENSGTTATRTLVDLINNGSPEMSLINTETGGRWDMEIGSGNLFAITLDGTAGFEMVIRENGAVRIGPGGAQNFLLNPAGNLTIAGTLTQNSSRTAKTDFELVDASSALAELAAMDVLEWSYIASPEQRHVGPISEDFFTAFELGADNAHLAPSDLSGVTLAGVQELLDIVAAQAENLALLQQAVGIEVVQPSAILPPPGGPKFDPPPHDESESLPTDFEFDTVQNGPALPVLQPAAPDFEEARETADRLMSDANNSVVRRAPEIAAAASSTSSPPAGGQLVVDQDVQPRDQVYVDDLIVDGSLCVGFDCSNGENFGFDTVRLKENNTRLTFIDTSSTASFPQRDWQIRANESSNGGRNAFFIDDLGNSATNGSSISSTPFTLEAGAATNSVYVDDGGRLGLGTATPVVDLHIVSGNSPAMRLEQNGTSGFTPQTWDVVGNEANFFIRDATNGSALPFRIRPGAPNSSIDIAASGNVGVGTGSPNAQLHVRRSNGTASLRVEEASTTSALRTLMTLENNGAPRISMADTQAGGASWNLGMNSDDFTINLASTAGEEFRIDSDGRVTMGPNGAQNFVLDPAGNLTLAGTFTPGSSRTIKDNLTPVDTRSVLSQLAALDVLEWTYLSTPDVRHVSPVAEDFYAAFGLGADDMHLAPSDLAGVTLAGVQELFNIARMQAEQIEAIQAAIDVGVGEVGVGGLVFSNQTINAGLTAQHATTLEDWEDGSLMMGGVAAGDFNNDGWVDVYHIGGGGQPDSLFINQQDGTFVNVAEQAGLADLHVGSGAAVADYDGDGWLDIFVTSFGDVDDTGPGQHRLYHNNGDLTFTDVAVEAGVNQTSETLADGFGATFGDYDLDGDLDLFVAGWRVRPERALGNRLFANNGDGTFTDVTETSGIVDNGTRGFSPTLVDMDGDRYPELLLVADFGTSQYYINNADGTFTEYSDEAGTGLEWSGMGSTVGDFNNDGLLDWYTTAIYDPDGDGRGDGNKLYINEGGHQYREIAIEAGVADGAWGWGAAAVDLNRDGWLDIVETNGWELPAYVEQPARVWLNNGDETFTEVADATGFTHELHGLGLLTLDYDQDGDQDVVIGAINDELQLYRNDLANGNHWLQVVLDTSANPGLPANGIGARVEVDVDGQVYVDYVLSETHYLSQSELVADFGLGQAATRGDVTVTWPDGTVTVEQDVALDQRITLTPDSAAVANPLDANGDGEITPIDALRVINGLNDLAAGLPVDVAQLDVNRDGKLTPVDALRIINALNNPTPVAAAALPEFFVHADADVLADMARDAARRASGSVSANDLVFGGLEDMLDDVGENLG